MEVCEVEADGDCFYKCLVLCVREDDGVWNSMFPVSFREQQAVSRLRRIIARHVCGDEEVREWLASLIRLHKETGGSIQLTEDNPLLAGASSLADVARNITGGRVWASQVEVGVARRLLSSWRIALVVVEGETASAADQLLAALDKVQLPRCIVLIRVHDCHYRFLRAHGTVSNTGWLIYATAVTAMLEDEDDQLF